MGEGECYLSFPFFPLGLIRAVSMGEGPERGLFKCSYKGEPTLLKTLDTGTVWTA